MELSGKQILVVGGAGFIVDGLLSHNVAEVVIYDNFAAR